MKKIFVECVVSILAAAMLVSCGETATTGTGGSETAAATADAETGSETLSFGQTMHTDYFDITAESAQMMDKITTEAGMTYAADPGQHFLVVFFKATSTAADAQNVMNTNFISSVDGTSTTVEGVVGKIDGKMPLLGGVNAGDTFEGYAVWKVPEGWQELKITYSEPTSGKVSDEAMVIKSTDVGL